jgi:hypothetical protein
MIKQLYISFRSIHGFIDLKYVLSLRVLYKSVNLIRGIWFLFHGIWFLTCVITCSDFYPLSNQINLFMVINIWGIIIHIIESYFVTITNSSSMRHDISVRWVIVHSKALGTHHLQAIVTMWFLNIWDNVPMDLKYVCQQYFTYMCFLGFIRYNKHLEHAEYHIPLERCPQGIWYSWVNKFSYFPHQHALNV